MMNEQGYLETIKSMRQRTRRQEREGDYWSDEEKAKLARMFHDCTGITEIAIRLQRTEPAVIQQIEKMDLYQRKENPIRRRDPSKAPSCLCGRCKEDCAFCPRCNPCAATQEGV